MAAAGVCEDWEGNQMGADLLRIAQGQRNLERRACVVGQKTLLPPALHPSTVPKNCRINGKEEEAT